MDDKRKKGKDDIADVKSRLGRTVFAPEWDVGRVDQLAFVLDRDLIKEEERI